jgi:hypothetical protein
MLLALRKTISGVKMKKGREVEKYANEFLSGLLKFFCQNTPEYWRFFISHLHCN